MSTAATFLSFLFFIFSLIFRNIYIYICQAYGHESERYTKVNRFYFFVLKFCLKKN